MIVGEILLFGYNIKGSWGYDYICLFDNDKDGVKVCYAIKKSLETPDEKLFYVSDTYGSTIESLLSDKIKEEINVGDKTLNAKKFAYLVRNKDTFLDEVTISNFKALLSKLGINE